LQKPKSCSAGKAGSCSAAQFHTGDPSLTLSGSDTENYWGKISKLWKKFKAFPKWYVQSVKESSWSS